MADVTKTPATAQTSPAQKSGKGARKRVSREERGLAPLDAKQRMIKQIVQNAENSCKLIKAQVDSGEPVPAELLQACSVLSSAMSTVLGV
jgi:hypothetical protein